MVIINVFFSAFAKAHVAIKSIFLGHEKKTKRMGANNSYVVKDFSGVHNWSLEGLGIAGQAHLIFDVIDRFIERDRAPLQYLRYCTGGNSSNPDRCFKI